MIKYLKYGAFAVAFIALGWLAFNSETNRLVIYPSKVITNPLGDSDEDGQGLLTGPPSVVQGDHDLVSRLKASRSDIETPINIISIGSANDFLVLKKGQNFIIEIDSGSLVSEMTLEVSAIVAHPEYTQIEGISEAGDYSVATISESMVNVFVKFDSRVYEYSGDNFDGIVSKLVRNQLDDDFDTGEQVLMLVPLDDPNVFEIYE